MSSQALALIVLTFGAAIVNGALGYGFSSITEAYVQQQLDLMLHKNSGGGQSSAPRLGTFRAGFRIGF